MLFREIKIISQSVTDRFAHMMLPLTALRLESLLRITDFLTVVGKVRNKDLAEITRPTHAEPEPKGLS